MAETSGALLLRGGLVRPEQIAEAAALRARDGGSFGECLVRVGAVTEEQLVEFYHKRLMIPRLADGKLEHVPLKVISLVPADMAAEFRVVPAEIDGEGTLTLAMADPSDNHAVDEVAFFVDRFVVRAVASESAVRRAIERYYGVRFTSPSIGPRAVEPAKKHKEVFAKPTKAQLDEQIVLLTKVKHSDATPLPIPVPPPDDFVPSYADDEPAEPEPEPIAAEPEPEPPVEEIAPDDAQPILLTNPISTAEPRRERQTLPGFPAVLAPDPPLMRLRAAQSRDEIAAAVLDYIGQLTGRVILFVVKKSLLVGHDARGGDGALVRQLTINLDAPSLFRDVVASRLPYRGPLPETASNVGFAQAVGGVSREVLLMPIAIRDRIIAVVFADGASQPLPDAALHATTREAGLAYERLIILQKHR